MKGKLFIAEDQFNFRKGLLKLAGKRSSEWVVTGEATNGRDALFMMEKSVPDLLLTDIRMPHIDGLQLTEEIRNRGWMTKIVIVTGFKDFSYAQSALKFGVQDFITKPCVETDILSVLDRIYVQLIQERQSQLSVEGWRSQLEDSELRSAIMGMPCTDEEVAALLKRMKQCELHFLRIPTYFTTQKHYNDQDIPLLQFAFSNIAGEHLIKWFPNSFRLLPLHASQWALLVDRSSSQLDISPLWQQVLTDSIQHYLGLQLEWSEQGLCSTAEELYQGYRQYCQEGERHYASANESLLNQTALYEKEKEIVTWLMSEDNSRLSKELQEQAKRIIQLPPQTAKIEALLLVTAILRLVQVQFPEWQIATRSIKWDDVYRCATSEDILAWLQCYTDEFLQSHNSWLASKNDNPVKQAIRFIEESYMEACGLTEVAAHVHLNPSYFSNLFKKETGEGVIGYIQKLRVQKAKLLLKSTNMKIFEISEAIGFNDSNYFTHMFNKIAGVSPKEYRKQMVDQ